MINWDALSCRHGCQSPVFGLYHAPTGCLCFDDPVQALCQQHAIKGQQNNDMRPLVERPFERSSYVNELVAEVTKLERELDELRANAIKLFPNVDGQ